MDHGVSTYPQDGDQRAQLIRISDERLYRSKHANHRKTETESESTQEPPPAPANVTEASPETDLPSAPVVAPLAPEPAIAFAPVVIPEPPPTSKTEAAPPPPALQISPLHQSPPAFPLAVPEPQLYAVPRKAERVSMAGTNAYAVLGDNASHRARVVDLGFGGVALDFPSVAGLSDTLFAVLHVPILPPVRVNLKRLWSRQLTDDTVRVGCCFIS